MHVQAEHAQALQQEHSRSAAVRADFEAQLQSCQQQLVEAREAAKKAHAADSRAKQMQQESAVAINQLQVL